MTVFRGFLIFAVLSASWAQTAATKKGAPPRRPASSAPKSKPAVNNAKVEAGKPAEPTIDEAAFKLLRAVAAKYKAMESYQLEASIDSGRQVAEDPRQSMSKADVKLRVAPEGKYILEVIEEDDAKLPYKVISNGKRKWTFIAEANQYRETPAAPTKPISAAEPVPDAPFTADEAYAERLMRQLLPLLANVDKTTENAFLRGRIITALSKRDAAGHSFLMYLTLDNDEGAVSKVSWYQSSGPETERMLLRTDFLLTSLKPVPAGSDDEFSFTPPPGATESKQAPTVAASSEYHKP